MKIIKNIEVSKLGAIFNTYTNSYKIYWFKGIMEEIINGNSEVYLMNLLKIKHKKAREEPFYCECGFLGLVLCASADI